MIFHSLDFVVFFFVTVTLYWRLSHRWQNRLLLAASYVFYGWVTPWFLILLVTSTSIDYWAALRMEADPAHRKRYLAFSVASNMGMLAYFKYANFFIDNVGAILTTVGLPTSAHVLNVVLPVGISFFTFQALSYTIDVYRGQLRARRSLVDVATFVAFFPQLVAGPIERASHLLPQVEGERRFSPDRARSGLLLMAWGFFKKLVIADNVGLVADKVFALEAPAFEMLWAGVFAFAIQIYADFSAYSDIARGTARWFGFELMVNFDHPYLARGPQDFWRRWHISLSTWFRDYVYIPLGGSRHGFARELAAILATFVLSGFWHGASWNYVLWGFYHGLLLVASRIRRRVLGERPAWMAVFTPLQIAGMFVLVGIGWLMFRETDITMLIRDLTLSPAASTSVQRRAGYALALRVLPFAAPLVVQSLWVECWRDRKEPARLAIVDGVLLALLFAAILVFRSQASMDFIYFQF
ncbi:MAG: MBOAT family protein [Vicinamibacteria bacterium]|nr:MBOAT family protein [Vicinamibacteria bacterium]